VISDEGLVIRDPLIKAEVRCFERAWL